MTAGAPNFSSLPIIRALLTEGVVISFPRVAKVKLRVMTESRIPAVRQIGATVWAREVTPLRRFLRTETGSAAFLLGATVAALVWVNISARSYASFWHTNLSVHLGSMSLAQNLHGWVNSGLITVF